MDWLLWEGDAGGVVGTGEYGDGDGGTEGCEEGVEGQRRGGGIGGGIVPVFLAVCGFLGESGVCDSRF